MTLYSNVFGGATIYPSEISYSQINLTENTQLYWPLDATTGTPLVTRIIDVDGATADLKLLMPPATMVSPGETVLFNNVGAEDVQVLNYDQTQLINLEPGTVWQLYLTLNTSAAGAWVALQYGAQISSANAAQLAGTGLQAYGAKLRASMPVIGFNSNYTLGVPDQAYTFVWTGTGSGTLTLADPGAVLNGWFAGVANQGGGTLTVTSDGSFTIDGETSKSFPPGASALVLCDGSNYYTLGFNQGASNNFDYTVIAVPGSGNYVLSGSELNRIAYSFTGVLTGNRNIIVPDVAQQYWVDNECTGAYDLTVKTLAGTGVVVSPGARRILYCDGADVVDADNTNFSTPVPIVDGGTGSTNVFGARINLGGTAIGIAVFTTPDGPTAYAALGPLQGGTF